MNRILCIVGRMTAGGVETFLMRVYRNLDMEKYQMDFCVSSSDEEFYDNEIKSMGGKVIYFVPKTKAPIRSFLQLRKIVQSGGYKKVIRFSSKALSSIDLLAAKLGGADELVFGASNTSSGKSRLFNVLHYIFRWMARVIPSKMTAPSIAAANFTFGKRFVKSGKVKLIKNSLPLKNFAFSNDKRISVQKELMLEGKYVIGHIGSFTYQKNHSFLLDIFSSLNKKFDNCILVLVGGGELETDIKNQIIKLGIEDKVILAGYRTDIPEILMSMDIFVFPSHYEGMPCVIIEAQATGLTCLISDTITEEIALTESVHFMSLNEDCGQWSEKIIELMRQSRERQDYYKRLEGEYDIEETTKDLLGVLFGDNE